MGCGSSVNNKDDQMRRELIMTVEASDTLNNIPSTPKNKIDTLNLIERLVMTLEEAIKNKQKIETFKDMLLTNNAKTEYKIDEVTYVMNTAQQHKEEIVKNSSFPVLCSKLSVQVRGVILDKIYAFQNRKEWF